MLEDIAILPVASRSSKRPALSSKAFASRTGQAKRVTIDKDKHTIVDGAGKTKDIEGRIKQLPSDRRNHVDYDREKLQSGWRSWRGVR